MSDQSKQIQPDAGVRDEADQSALAPPYYEIRLKGHLNSAWTDWLEGLEVKLLDRGETVLSGVIVDQASLMGLLNKLNSLNLALLSVNAIKRME